MRAEQKGPSEVLMNVYAMGSLSLMLSKHTNLEMLGNIGYGKNLVELRF